MQVFFLICTRLSYGALQHNTVSVNIALHITTEHNTMQYNNVLQWTDDKQSPGDRIRWFSVVRNENVSQA